MKTRRKLFAILIISAFVLTLLSGCTAPKQDALTPEEYSETVSYVSASVSNGISEYTYSGEYIKINYEYCISGARSFGLKVMCDGVETPFYTNFDKNEKLLHIINNELPGTPVPIEIYFVPIGNKGDTVSIDIVDIIEPDFDFSALDTEHLHPLIWGKKYCVGHISGIYVAMQTDGLPTTAEYCEEYAFDLIPEEIILESMYTDENGNPASTLQNLTADSTVNGQKSIYHCVEQGKKLNIKITYNGTQGEYIYTCFYLDNELYPAFSGAYYSKAYIDSEHYTDVCAVIDTANLEKGKYICYSACSDIPYCSVSPHEPFIIEVI